MSNVNNKYRFTLIELVVVLSIILILASLLVTALTTVKGKVETINCADNLKQLSIGITGYVTENYTKFPVRNGHSTGDEAQGWKMVISPYISGGEELKWWGVNDEDPYICPSFELPEGKSGKYDSGLGWNTEYMGAHIKYESYPAWAKYAQGRRYKISQVSILSETILAGDGPSTEGFSGPNWQLLTVTPPSKGEHLVGDRHNGGINLIWADGHVGWMDKIDLAAGDNGDQDYYYRREK